MENKNKLRIKELILHELLEIIQLWPDIPISQHIVTIMRPYNESFNWSNEMLLKKIERYRFELETDQDDEYEQ